MSYFFRFDRGWASLVASFSGHIWRRPPANENRHRAAGWLFGFPSLPPRAIFCPLSFLSEENNDQGENPKIQRDTSKRLIVHFEAVKATGMGPFSAQCIIKQTTRLSGCKSANFRKFAPRMSSARTLLARLQINLSHATQTKRCYPIPYFFQ